MLFLATFFPMSDVEEEEGEHKFDFLNDFLRATVDMADLVGIYLVMSRGVGFDWKYIQKSFDANISLLHFISLASLVWMWTKRNTTHGPGLTGVLSVVLGLACYKGLIVSGAAALLELGSWAMLVQDGLITSCLALVSLQLYLGVTSTEKY